MITDEKLVAYSLLGTLWALLTFWLGMKAGEPAGILFVCDVILLVVIALERKKGLKGGK